MANIGKPERRHEVVPLKREAPTNPSEPLQTPAPSKVPSLPISVPAN